MTLTISTALAAAMRQYRTATMSIIWLAIICITPMGIIAMTMVPCCSPDIIALK
jgi:hypothetical protein